MEYTDVTIANSGTESTALDLGNTTGNTRVKSVVGIYTPAALTGTAISFKASSTLAGTYVAVEDGSGAVISKTVSASKFIVLDPADFVGIQFLKIVSNGTEAAERVFKIVHRVFQ